MSSEFICGGQEYEVYYPTGTIGMLVPLDGLPLSVKVQEDTFYLPTPYHVSLFYTGRLIDKYNISIPDFKNKIIEDFCEFTKINEITLTGYKNEYRLAVCDDSMKTIIVMCEVSNLNKFFDLMNKKYKLKIKYPVPHITLYNTLKGKPGWYLLDSDDVEKYTTPINNPIGREL